MTVGHDYDLQKGMVTALKASAELKTLIGTTPRIYQDVPTKPDFPYVTLGSGQTIDASNHCLVGSEIFADVHVWSKVSGFEELKQISAVVRDTLHEAALTMSENRLFVIQFRDIRTFRDGDGVTKHAVLTFRARVESTT